MKLILTIALSALALSGCADRGCRDAPVPGSTIGSVCGTATPHPVNNPSPAPYEPPPTMPNGHT